MPFGANPTFHFVAAFVHRRFFIYRTPIESIMSWDWKGFAALFVIGIVILSAGVAIDLFVNSTISGLQTLLRQTGLSTDQINAAQGGLNWWQIQKITVYEPLSVLAETVGLLFILFSILYGTLSVWHGTRVEELRKLKPELIEEKQPEPKTRVIHKTGFPIAAGILTIIAASLTIVNALLLVIQIGNISSIIYYFEHNLSWLVFALFVGIWHFVAFGLGLTGGIFSIKRKRFTLVIVGISFLMVGSFQYWELDYRELG